MSHSGVVVLITAPKGPVARKIAMALLKSRLAACVNIVPDLSSIYLWKGKIERAKETQLIIKSRRPLLKKLIAAVRRAHPYSVPEIIALPIVEGHKPYLAWINDETKG